jgi:hypothetical protein
MIMDLFYFAYKTAVPVAFQDSNRAGRGVRLSWCDARDRSRWRVGVRHDHRQTKKRFFTEKQHRAASILLS